MYIYNPKNMLGSLLLLCSSYYVNLNIAKYLEKRFNSVSKSDMIMSFSHSFLVVWGSLSYLYSSNFTILRMVRLYSIGHLLADCYYFQYLKDVNKNKHTYIIHHLLFITSWLVPNYYDKVIYSKLLLSEISVLPLNLMYYYKQERNTKLELYYAGLTYTLFFIFRIVNFTYQYSIILERGQYILSFLFIPLTGLQYYWFYLMTRKLMKKIYYPE